MDVENDESAAEPGSSARSCRLHVVQAPGASQTAPEDQKTRRPEDQKT
ncbi:MAG: hypothetical protein ACJAYU_004654, partial [Bradymonadia bacterium]